MAKADRGVRNQASVQRLKVKINDPSGDRYTSISMDPSLWIALKMLVDNPVSWTTCMANKLIIENDTSRSISRSIQAMVIRLLVERSGIPIDIFDRLAGQEYSALKNNSYISKKDFK